MTKSRFSRMHRIAISQVHRNVPSTPLTPKASIMFGVNRNGTRYSESQKSCLLPEWAKQFLFQRCNQNQYERQLHFVAKEYYHYVDLLIQSPIVKNIPIYGH